MNTQGVSPESCKPHERGWDKVSNWQKYQYLWYNQGVHQVFNINHTNVTKIKDTQTPFEPEGRYQNHQTTPTLLQVHKEQETIIGQTHQAGIINTVGGILWKLKDDAVTAKRNIFRKGKNQTHIP